MGGFRGAPLKNICTVLITLVLNVRDGKRQRSERDWALVEGERAREALPWYGGWFEKRRAWGWAKRQSVIDVEHVCGLQDGAHANGGALPYCYLAEKAERSISVARMYSQVALKREEGRTEAWKKPPGQRSTDLYESSKSNFLIGSRCRVWESVGLPGPLRAIGPVLIFYSRTLDVVTGETNVVSGSLFSVRMQNSQLRQKNNELVVVYEGRTHSDTQLDGTLTDSRTDTLALLYKDAAEAASIIESHVEVWTLTCRWGFGTCHAPSHHSSVRLPALYVPSLLPLRLPRTAQHIKQSPRLCPSCLAPPPHPPSLPLPASPVLPRRIPKAPLTPPLPRHFFSICLSSSPWPVTSFVSFVCTLVAL